MILSDRAKKGHITHAFRKIEIKKLEAHQDKINFIADYLRMGGCKLAMGFGPLVLARVVGVAAQLNYQQWSLGRGFVSLSCD